MGIQLTANTGAATSFYRKNSKGVVELSDERIEYTAPLPGQYRIQLFGISEPFEMESQYGKSTNVRLEWLVRGGKRSYVGKVFSDLATLTLGPKSNLGKITRALLNREIADGEQFELTDLIELEIGATVKQETKPDKTGQLRTYAKVVADSVMPIDDEDDDEDNGTPLPSTKPKAKKNPFQMDEDDE